MTEIYQKVNYVALQIYFKIYAISKVWKYQASFLLEIISAMFLLTQVFSSIVDSERGYLIRNSLAYIACNELILLNIFNLEYKVEIFSVNFC